ncbi:hypothetical protein GQ43DRAFT_270901 [Delitschia confertaspora ATCC 74209]|uniref:Steroid 5-alpha reductase C-terminal domain-containing protein n=1 Tax=Delitschia confertaspora ATCC 74209 TaxID=1513339 RepID=A0A9P4MU76_9PLEO|nr:hypothetical protein GQ43DRAFT_270901 [Delitschia confertaspora ATCC 74209]
MHKHQAKFPASPTTSLPPGQGKTTGTGANPSSASQSFSGNLMASQTTVTPPKLPFTATTTPIFTLLPAKLQSSPYSPQKHRTSFWRILHSTLIQSTHTALRMLPLLTLNALPRSAFTIARIQNITDTLPMPLSAHRYSTDLIGIMLSFSGPIFQIVADTDNFLWRKGTGYTKHMNRSKNAGTATSRMALHAYNFGEVMVWTGMAVVCGGILLKEPALAALGLAGWSGKMVVIEICAASPVATAVRLWMECEGESEEMRTEDAHIE